MKGRGFSVIPRQIILPGDGLSLQMHDRNNQQLPIGVLEDNGIGKAMGETTAGTGGKIGPGSGKMQDAGNGSTDLGGKLKAKARALIIVVGNRSTEFFLRRRKELNCSLTIH